MQVEAIYDHGKLEFSRPSRLRHQRIKVVVEVPDMEIDDSSYLPTPEAQKIADEIDKQIDAALNAPLPINEDLPALTEKEKSRIAAFALREDR